MIDISVEIDESAIEDEVMAAASEAFKDFANGIPDAMRLEMALSPPTGRRRGNKVSASRGNPPRNQSGALDKSFDVRMTGDFQAELKMLGYGEDLDLNGFPFIEQAIEMEMELTKKTEKI